MSQIPQKSREEVSSREKAHCLRCGGWGSAWHHRRGRSVVDEWTHDSTNGILLCDTCHRWVHSEPIAARKNGWIVSRAVAVPGDQPVFTYWGAWIRLLPGGAWIPTTPPIEEHENGNDC